MSQNGKQIDTNSLCENRSRFFDVFWTILRPKWLHFSAQTRPKINQKSSLSRRGPNKGQGRDQGLALGGRGGPWGTPSGKGSGGRGVPILVDGKRPWAFGVATGELCSLYTLVYSPGKLLAWRRRFLGGPWGPKMVQNRSFSGPKSTLLFISILGVFLPPFRLQHFQNSIRF